MAFAEDLRLLWFVCLNAIVVYSAWRIATRFGGRSPSHGMLDTMLLSYLIQYVVVCGLGAIGALSPATITVAAGLIAVGVFWVTSRSESSVLLSIRLTPEGRCAMAIYLFAAGYLLSYAIYRKDLPVLETDALAYHLPTAIGWLQSGHLQLFESWYWNPANTYSPLAAEAFMAWLLAPMRSDVFVRFVQTPALMMVGLGMYRIGRHLGARPVVAACVASATMLSRSMFAQATLVKDDLFVAAFFISALAALCEGSPVTRTSGPCEHPQHGPDARVTNCIVTNECYTLGAWRVGIALALLISTKYPALLTLPLVLLAFDTPLRRWGRKQWRIVSLVIGVVAAPWFIRNWLDFANPLFPMIVRIGNWQVFNGIFNVTRASTTRTPLAIWTMISQGYLGTPPMLLIVLGVLWAMAVVRFGRQTISAGSESPVATQPALRLAIWGPVVGPVLFSLASPHPEIRYFLPFMLQLFAAACLGLRLLDPWRRLQIAAAILLATGAAMTSFAWSLRVFIVDFAVGGIVLAALGWLIVAYWMNAKRVILGAGVATGLLLLLLTYVYWHAYTSTVIEIAGNEWTSQYGPMGQAWSAVRDYLPPDATIAYANTYLVYPLLGPHYQRRVVYAPVRADERSFANLPRLGDRVQQDRIVETVTAAMNDHADATTWLKNLHSLGVHYVFIARHERTDDPPELRFVNERPMVFHQIFENDAAIIYTVESTPTPKAWDRSR